MAKKHKQLDFYRKRMMDIILYLEEHGNKWKMIKDRTYWALLHTKPKEGKVLQFPVKEAKE